MLYGNGLRFTIEMVKSSRETTFWKAESWSDNLDGQEFNQLHSSEPIIQSTNPRSFPYPCLVEREGHILIDKGENIFFSGKVN